MFRTVSETPSNEKQNFMEKYNPIQMQPEETTTEKIPVVDEKKKELDFQGEDFLNPENMPPVPASDKEKQQESFYIHREYQQMISGTLFETVIRPNMSAEDIDLLVKGTEEKRQISENEEEDEVAEEMFTEEAEENKKEIPQNDEERKISVFSHAAELMHGYLEKHPKLAKFVMVGVVAAELASHSAEAYGHGGFENVIGSIAHAGVNVMQTQITTQNQIYTQQLYTNANNQKTMMYAQNLAQRTAENGAYSAQANYQMAVRNAEQMRTNAYNYLGHKATHNEQARIEADYNWQIKNAEMQARQIAEQAQVQAQQIMQQAQMQVETNQINTNMQAQATAGYSNAYGQAMVINTGANILMQAIGGMHHR